MRNTYFFILTSFIFFFNSTFANSNDYMSTELHKAIDIECKQAVKKNLYNSKDECESSLIESLNKVGIVSVTRVNDEEVQDDIERICVFAKKRGALEYNKCVHKRVYLYLGIEIIEMPLVVNKPISEEKTKEINEKIETVESLSQDEDETKNINEEIINEEEIYLSEKNDNDKVVINIDPERPVTERTEIDFPKNFLKIISDTAIPSTYFVQTWMKNPDEKSKIKYLPAGLGSAVAIEPDLLATACHVVTKRSYNKSEEKFEFEYLRTNVIHVNEDSSNQSKWFRKLELYAHDFNSDRCILKFENLNAVPAVTRNYEDLNSFETVYAVGNPRGYLGKTAQGTITRLYDYVPPVDHLLLVFRDKQIQLIETNAPVDKGNSGGGLFDSNGKLIGIASQCAILGGPVMCFDKYGRETLNPENPDEQCQVYCNKTQPQNWFIPISRHPELINE